MTVVNLVSASAGAHDRFCELPTGVRLCYRVTGDEAGEPVLLIAGLGLQLTSWPKTMVDDLKSRGYRLITLDNRDVGRSTKVAAPPPAVWRQALRKPRPDAYDLNDMAADTIAVLDHLGVASAHVVGMSMGGMIAQQIAAWHPQRVRSLTSIFSTTGAAKVGQPKLLTMLRLMAPPARTKEQFIARYHGMIKHIAGTVHAINHDEVLSYAAQAWERGDGATAHEGVARQIGAIFKSGDRTQQLGRIQAPTLVIHGDSDPLVQPSGGTATAAAVPGAQHVIIAGMGHYLADAVVPRIVGLIDELVQRAAPPRSAASLAEVKG